MARSINTIYNQIVSTYVSLMGAVGITINTSNWSRRNIQSNTINTVATAQAITEQMWDVYISQNEAIIASAAAGTAAWLQNAMFLFQYDATIPQIIQFNTTTFAPYYVTVDASKRIIGRCSVTKGNFNTVNLKVATSTPSKLTSGQLSAAQAYINIIGDAGITYSVTSLDPDLLYVNATVYYNGLYSSQIAVTNGTVVQAVINFLANASSQPNFGGTVKVSDLEAAIKNVTGVNDVVLNNVSVRPAAISWGSGLSLVSNNQLLLKDYTPIAGYLIGETTSGQTLNDSITYIAQ